MRLLHAIDRVVVLLVKLVICSLFLRSRDPREHWTRVFKADVHTQTRQSNWEAILKWPAERRVGCLAGVLIGALLGLAFIAWRLA